MKQQAATDEKQTIKEELNRRGLIISLILFGAIMCMLFGTVQESYAVSRQDTGTDVGMMDFVLEVDGVVVATFTEEDFKNSGFGCAAAVKEYRDGSTGMIRKLQAGEIRCNDFTVSVARHQSTFVVDWWKNIKKGQPDARTMRIIQYTDDAAGEQSWVLYNCWPKAFVVDVMTGAYDFTFVVEDVDIVQDEMVEVEIIEGVVFE